MKIAKQPLFKSASKQVVQNITTVVQDSQLSLTGFEKATGLSRKTLKRIEEARRFRRPYNPQLSTLLKIATATGVTVGDVVSSKLVTG